MFKKILVAVLFLVNIFPLLAYGDDMAVIYKNGEKQVFSLKQKTSNIFRIDLGSNVASGIDKIAPDIAANYVKGFVGKWNSRWGVIVFSTDGLKVMGNYTYGNGRITASLSRDGKTMEGIWAEAPSYSDSDERGRCTFSLTPDTNRIDGHWWYGDGSDGGDWSGVRIE